MGSFNSGYTDNSAQISLNDVENVSTSSNNGNAYGGYGTKKSKQTAKEVADANFNTELKRLAEQQKAATKNYKYSIKGNQERADAAIKDIATDDEWFNTQLKLQNTYKNQRDANGNGAYGSGLDSLNNVVRTYDAVQDKSMLNSEQQAKNNIYSDLQQANLDSINTYNNILAATKEDYYTAQLALANDYYNNAGSTQLFQRKPTKKQSKLIKRYLQNKNKSTSKKSVNKHFKKLANEHLVKYNKINNIANKSYINPDKLKYLKYQGLHQDLYTRQPSNTDNIRNNELNGISDVSNSSGANVQYLQKRYG
jgi:hypothetical protein